MSVNDFEVLKIDLKEVTNGYDTDNFDVAVLRGIKREEIPDKMLNKKVKMLLLLFHRDGEKLLFEGKIRVPRKAIYPVLQLAHDAKAAGRFGYFRTLSRLKNFH